MDINADIFHGQIVQFEHGYNPQTGEITHLLDTASRRGDKTAVQHLGLGIGDRVQFRRNQIWGVKAESSTQQVVPSEA